MSQQKICKVSGSAPSLVPALPPGLCQESPLLLSCMKCAEMEAPAVLSLLNADWQACWLFFGVLSPRCTSLRSSVLEWKHSNNPSLDHGVVSRFFLLGTPSVAITACLQMNIFGG